MSLEPILEGHVIPAPDHGAVIDRRTVTEVNGSTAMTHTAGRKLCRVHGWSEYAGIVGALRWHVEHDDCAKEEG